MSGYVLPSPAPAPGPLQPLGLGGVPTPTPTPLAEHALLLQAVQPTPTPTPLVPVVLGHVVQPTPSSCAAEVVAYDTTIVPPEGLGYVLGRRVTVNDLLTGSTPPGTKLLPEHAMPTNDTINMFQCIIFYHDARHVRCGPLE